MTNGEQPEMSPDQPANPNALRVVERVIASAVVITADDYVLMGRKDPAGGGVYPDAWHLPGGGVETDETLQAAMLRELAEEVEGIDVAAAKITPLDVVDYGATEKTLPSGERVWARMQFNRFEVRLPLTAAELQGIVRPGSDFAEVRLFSPEELRDVQQIPGGKEFFQKAGYLA